MLEFLKRDSASVPVATAGRSVVFVGTDGKVYAKDETGAVAVVVGAKGDKGDAGERGSNGAGFVRTWRINGNHATLTANVDNVVFSASIPAGGMSAGDVIEFAHWGAQRTTATGSASIATLRLGTDSAAPINNAAIAMCPYTSQNSASMTWVRWSGIVYVTSTGVVASLAEERLQANAVIGGNTTITALSIAPAMVLSLHWNSNNASCTGITVAGSVKQLR